LLQISYAPGQHIKQNNTNSKKGKSVPELSEGGRFVDLRINYSANNIKEPTEARNQKSFINPVKSVPLPFVHGRDHYEHNWVYLSFFSESGCSVKVSVVFKDDKNTWARRMTTMASLPLELMLEEMQPQQADSKKQD
jgi:hypothetical protein